MVDWYAAVVSGVLFTNCVDTVAPTVNFTSTPALLSNTGFVAVAEVSSNEAVMFECDFGEGDFVPCTEQDTMMLSNTRTITSPVSAQLISHQPSDSHSLLMMAATS